MKKIVLFISFFVFSILSVQAKENKLYFTEENDRLYYESKLIDEDVFMKHIDMTPGESFTDELLENIIMNIKLDGKEIYNGKATGLDYTEQGVNLQKAILLGDFTPSKNSKMVVETKLKEDYNNTNFHELSYIDWSFYAQYDNNSDPLIINPKTSTISNNNLLLPIILIIIVLISIIGIKNKKTI